MCNYKSKWIWPNQNGMQIRENRKTLDMGHLLSRAKGWEGVKKIEKWREEHSRQKGQSVRLFTGKDFTFLKKQKEMWTNVRWEGSQFISIGRNLDFDSQSAVGSSKGVEAGEWYDLCFIKLTVWRLNFRGAKRKEDQLGNTFWWLIQENILTWTRVTAEMVQIDTHFGGRTSRSRRWIRCRMMKSQGWFPGLCPPMY